MSRRLAKSVEAPVFQVHEQEGQIAGDVDPAEGRVELDAVKQGHLAFEQGDIAQVQVAMALPDKTVGTACGQVFPQAFKGALRPASQGVQLRAQIGLSPQTFADLVEVLLYGP